MRKETRNFKMNKWNSRLSVQLIISFFGMFVIIVIIAFISLYFGIEKILVDHNERSLVSQFSQYEYNINTFCDDVDTISRQLINQSEIQNLVQYRSMSESDRIYYMHLTFQKFTDVMHDYKFIDSVSYFGSDGLVLNSSDDGNYIQERDSSAEKWFYQTAAYQNTKKSGQKLVWFGGYSSLDFSESKADGEISLSFTPIYYVSAARGTMAGGLSGILVLNIDAHYFTSIFNHSANRKDNTIFMIDNGGKIIATLDYSLIGKKSHVFQPMAKTENIRNIILTDKGKKQQVISYRLVNLNSVLISEIPFSTIHRDVTLLRWILMTLLLFSMATALLTSRKWVFRLLDPLNQLVHAIRRTGEGALGLTLPTNSKNELGILIRQFNSMSTNIKELFEKNKQIEIEKRKFEIDALRWQINPHFLYNTLDTIKWMAMIRNENNIVECVTSLSDFLEPIFRGESIFCTLGDEINHIGNYIALMNYRFAGKFEYHNEIPKDLQNLRVMRFILQPIVENALTHGLADCPSGKICLKAWTNGTTLLIQVEDNGVGITPVTLKKIQQKLEMNAETTQQRRIGLSNVNRRLKLQFGEKFGVEIESQISGGTKVRLSMPIVQIS